MPTSPRAGPPAQTRRAHIGRDHACGVRFVLAVLLVDAERARQIGIEFAGRNRRLAHIALLRRLAEPARDRRAGTVRAGEIGAAIERIVRRRLELGGLLLAHRSLFPSPLWGGVRGGGREALRVR